jgi:hypothetical protein
MEPCIPSSAEGRPDLACSGYFQQALNPKSGHKVKLHCPLFMIHGVYPNPNPNRDRYRDRYREYKYFTVGCGVEPFDFDFDPDFDTDTD